LLQCPAYNFFHECDRALHRFRNCGFLLSVPLTFAQAPGQQQQPQFVKKGQQLIREGKPEEALAVYRRTLQSSPDSMPANIAAGSVLDLMGKGEEAQKYFAKAIEVASTPDAKTSAQRAIAMSYAFEGNCAKAIQYERQVFDFYITAKNFFQAGEAADEGVGVCIDSGDLDTAYKRYKIGHDTGVKEPNIKPTRRDLWDFRWEHAQARIAVRRGNRAEAEKHVAAAKAILDGNRFDIAWRFRAIAQRLPKALDCIVDAVIEIDKALRDAWLHPKARLTS
jgi:tetratricopeptide repeat protein